MATARERDHHAFISKAVEQFEAMARRIGDPFRAQAWDDDGEAVLAVWQNGEEAEVLRVMARLDDAAAAIADFDEVLKLTVNWDGDATEMLTLGWSGSTPDVERGLDTSADHAEGEYADAVGKIMQRVQHDILAALKSRAAPRSRSLIQPPSRPTSIIDTPFEVVKPAPAQKAPNRTTAADQVPQTAPEPDLELLRHALAALPEGEGLQAKEIFAGFIKAAGSRSPLRQGDIAAFVQGGLAELHAFQEAYLEGRSTFTQAGLGLKGLALIGALLVAMGAETMTGIFAFGPIIGHTLAALPVAGVGSFLIGGGMLPMATTDKARTMIVRVAVAWALAVSALSARNPDLAGPAQAFFTLDQKAADAQTSAEATRLKFEGIGKRVSLAREGKARSEEAYLKAKKNRPLVLDKAAGDLKTLEKEEQAASDAWVAAESAKRQALKSDPSRSYAEAVVFVICSILNAMGPIFIGQYLSRAESDHRSALAKARQRRHAERQAKLLRESQSAQRQRARVMLTAMRSYYTDVLAKSGRFTDTETEKMVNAAFGNAGAIVKEAVEEFRASLRPKRALVVRLFSKKKALG